MKEILHPKLENAVEIARLHPDKFEVPYYEKLDMLCPSHMVKVCYQAERFWCEIQSIDKGVIIGRVDNDLLNSELQYDMLIEIKRENIYDVII